MKALAEFAMRGRKESILAAILCTSLPMMFIVGAALVGLTILRKGLSQGVVVLGWAILPAIGWLILSADPSPLLVVVGTAALAAVLRTSVSWSYSLIASLVIGVICGSMLQWLAPEVIQALVEAGGKLIADANMEQLKQLDQAQIDLFLEQLMISMSSAAHVVFMLMGLMLARYWQSALYNPGGFQQEFHALRIPGQLAMALIAVVMLGGSISPAVSGWLPLITVPFAVSGLALAHGLVGKRGLGRGWIVGLYVLLVMAMPYMYTVLVIAAVIDSLADFRSRAETATPV